MSTRHSHSRPPAGSGEVSKIGKTKNRTSEKIAAGILKIGKSASEGRRLNRPGRARGETGSSRRGDSTCSIGRIGRLGRLCAIVLPFPLPPLLHPITTSKTSKALTIGKKRPKRPKCPWTADGFSDFRFLNCEFCITDFLFFVRLARRVVLSVRTRRSRSGRRPCRSKQTRVHESGICWAPAASAAPRREAA